MSAAIEILVGAARRGKTPMLLGEYRSALENSRRDHSWGTSLWLAPTARARADVLDRLLGESLPVCFSPNVFTFKEFAEAILKWCPQDVTAVSDVARKALLRTIVGDLLHDEQLPYFAPIAETAGFLRLASDFISELKRDEIWPEQFADACRRHGESPKDHELLLIYEHYQKQLVELDLYDDEGRFWSARTELYKGELGPFRNLLLVVVDGFTDFTETQYEILDKLAELSRRMLISLPVESPLVRTDLFAKSEVARQRLASLSASRIEVRDEDLRARDRGDLPAFDHIADQLFANPRDVAQETDARGLEVIATTGQFGEVEVLAERVKRLLLDGAGPDQIVVAFRALDEYADIVVEVFTQCGIPHVCESGIPLSQIPVIKALCGALKLESESWKFERLTAVLGSSYFRPSWEECDVDLARRAVAETLRGLRIHADRETMLRALEREVRRRDEHPEKARPGDPDFGLALRLMQKLSLAIESLRRKMTLVEWAQSLTNLARELGMKPRRRAADDSGLSEAERRDSDAWQLFFRSLDSVAEMETRGGRKPPRLALEDFQSVLDELILPQTLPRGVDERGRVRVVDAVQVRGLDVPHLFLAGLSEGSFPRIQNDDCLYNEAERRSLNACGLSLGHRSSRSQDEMLLFYGVVTRATKSLVLSYPSISSAGQPLFPSPYLAALRDLFDAESLPVTRIEELDPVPSADRIQSSADLRLVATKELSFGRPGLFAAMVERFESAPIARNILAAVDMAFMRFRERGFTAFEGLLKSEKHLERMRLRFPPDYQFSATQLEAYASCPFRFFVSDVLGLMPLESPRAETDFLRRGVLLHGVLAHLHRELVEAGAEGTGDADQPLAARFCELVSDHLKRRVHPTELQKVLAGIEERLLHDWAAAYDEQLRVYRDDFAEQWDEPPRPAWLEVAFGNAPSDEEEDSQKESFASLTIGSGSRQVRVRGRIDRIDVGQLDGRPVFNVIDYKSGTPPRFSLEDVRAGMSLQLALYTLAAARMNLAGEGAVPFQMGYWSIRETGYVSGLKGKAKALDEAAMKSLERLLEEVLPTLVHGMRSGQFPVDSLDPDCTGRCPYSTVCRVNQIRPLADKLEKRRNFD